MGLGRVHHPRSAALPGGGAQCGVGLQLVEPVRAVRRTGTPPGSGDQPALVVVRRGPAGRKRPAAHPAADQHTCRSRAGAGAADKLELVLERVKKHCGAVEPSPMLGTHLGENFGPAADPNSRVAWPKRVNPPRAGEPNRKFGTQRRLKKRRAGGNTSSTAVFGFNDR